MVIVADWRLGKLANTRSQRDTRSKPSDIANVKTLLFLLSKLIWIEGDKDIQVFTVPQSLKEISKSVKVNIISSQYLHEIGRAHV